MVLSDVQIVQTITPTRTNAKNNHRDDIKSGVRLMLYVMIRRKDMSGKICFARCREKLL